MSKSITDTNQIVIDSSIKSFSLTLVSALHHFANSTTSIVSTLVLNFSAFLNITLAFFYSPNFVPPFHSCIKDKNCSFLRKTNVPYFPVFSAHLTTKPHNVLNNGHDKSTTQMEKEMPNMWNHQHLSSQNLLAFFELSNCNFFRLESVAAASVFSTLNRRKNQNSKPLENPDYTQFMALEGNWDAAGICYFPLE